jgi:hypothetical protein
MINSHINLSKPLNYFLLLSFLSYLLFLTSCATNHAQYGSKVKNTIVEEINGNKIQTFYFVGNTADIHLKGKDQNLKVIKETLNKADSASFLVFLGDNYNPALKKIKEKLSKEDFASEILKVHLDIAEDFKGKTLFVPGNLDWKLGIEGLKYQEEYFKSKLKNPNYFLPQDGCGLGKIKVNDSIGVIAVDSQWFLEDWDNHPEINEKCDIKSKEDFYTEFESLLNKFQNRTTLIVLHHPLATNSVHGGKFSLIDNLFPFEAAVPLPVVGSVLNLIRSTGGLSEQDLQNVNYRDFASRISTLIQDRDNVILVSGHDQNLQYVEKDNLKQIISGSISDSKPAKVSGVNDFSFGGEGFATIDVYNNGISTVNFFEINDGKANNIFSKQLTDSKKDYSDIVSKHSIDSLVISSVYKPEDTDVSKFYQFVFGEHYRDIYGRPISLNAVDLSEQYGGIIPVRMDKARRANLLKLTDNEKKRHYNLEPVRKSATSYIQAIAYKNDYVVKEFKNTFTEKFLLDFYTASHPFYPLVIPTMQNALGVHNSNIDLIFIPKQPALKEYNEFFGDEMYLIDELPTTENVVVEDLGNPINILSTDEMLAKVHQDKSILIDKDLYMRIRLFDMLIGDWHRTAEQWDWAEFNKDGKTIFKALPKKRDQIFSKYDGLFFNVALGNPALKHFQDYKDDIPNVKWFNRKAYTLDLAILEASDLEDWNKQVKFVQDNLTEDVIRKAFENLPNEAKSENDDRIIETLLKRKEKLVEFAEDYHKVLAKTVILKGTNERDEILITRLPKGITNIKIFSGDDKELVLDRDFNKKETKEIRIYGLNDRDTFRVDGKGSSKILVRLIGGIDDDTYDIKSSKKIRVYDYKNGNSVENSSILTSRRFMNDYEINTYDYKTPKYDLFTMQPNFGYNPDDGLKIGLAEIVTLSGFESHPFSQKHYLNGDYFFATKGFDFKYKGSFMKVFGNWNIDLNARYTSPTFSINFFGLGNNTINEDDILGMNYNRVRQKSYEVGPSFYKIFRNKARLDLFANYSYVKVEDNIDRIVHFSKDINPDVFYGQHFSEIGGNYLIRNYDNESLPTLGMTFLANAKWVMNNDYIRSNFLKVELNLGFTHKITSEGRLTFASMLKAKSIFGEGFEFYQAAFIGGDNDLRGYRVGRFTGNRSFIQSSDLRYDLLKLKIGIPMRLGIFSGFDYGRVWLKDEESNKWHTSFGGGIWLNGAQLITARISYFKGADPGRIVFGLNFGF